MNLTIKEASEFVIKRVSAELRCKNNAEALIIAAAKNIISIAYKYGINPTMFSFSTNPMMESEINQVISNLILSLEEETYTEAVKVDEKEKDSILARVSRTIYGYTFEQRTEKYANMLKSEIEVFVIAGMLYNISQSKLLSEFKGSLDNPYSNKYVVEAIKSSPSASYIRNMYATGKGIYNSATNNIFRLLRYTVSDAWMWYDFESMRKYGVTKYYVRRGSSYPCALCDSMVGVHDISEGEIVPIHPNCKCIQFPITDDKI